MKAFVITIDEVYDYEEMGHKPEVFLNEEKAKARFKELVEDAKAEYEETYDDYDSEEYNNKFECYEEGYASQNHYYVRLEEVEVEE